MTPDTRSYGPTHERTDHLLRDTDYWVMRCDIHKMRQECGSREVDDNSPGLEIDLRGFFNKERSNQVNQGIG